MRIGIRTRNGSEDRIIFGAQIGADGGSIWLPAMPGYEKVFQDEGDLDMVAVLRALKEVGFENWIVNDHEPVLQGDGGWGDWRPHSLAWQVGYIRGLLQSHG